MKGALFDIFIVRLQWAYIVYHVDIRNVEGLGGNLELWFLNDVRVFLRKMSK